MSPSAMFVGAETRLQLIVLPATRPCQWRAENPFSAGPPSSLTAVILIRLTPCSPYPLHDSATLGFTCHITVHRVYVGVFRTTAVYYYYYYY